MGYKKHTAIFSLPDSDRRHKDFHLFSSCFHEVVGYNHRYGITPIPKDISFDVSGSGPKAAS